MSINKTTQMILSVEATLPYICWVIPATIDAKISKETQLEIHFSVINSPIHIKSTDPTVITNADKISVTGSVGMTLPPSK